MSATLPGRLCLTFDDGPDPEWTPRLLDLLAEAGAPATFFVIGRATRAQAPLLRRAIAEGHAVGNHGWSHRHPWLLGRRAACDEVIAGARAIADATGRPARHYRPAHGRVRRCMTEAAAGQGQALQLWSLSAIDWGPLGSAAGIARRLARAGAGDVILMHDGRPGPNRPAELLRALPGFLSGLRARGLVAATLP